MSFFGIGLQLGGAYSDRLVGPIHILLNRVFDECMDKSRYATELDEFSIVFRVAGAGNDFDGGDGCEYLKKIRGKDEITIDYVILEKKWQEYMVPVKARLVDKIIRYDIISDEKAYEFREYIADAVRGCYKQLKGKAKKLGYSFDEEKMDADFKKAINQFLIEELPKM
jgi:hypothetical protein